MDDKKYVLYPDAKAFFSNWDKIPKEEQQEWERKIAVIKEIKKKKA